MTVEELMNFLQGVTPDYPVFVRENGVLVEAYYELLTGEESEPAGLLIKRKYPNV